MGTISIGVDQNTPTVDAGAPEAHAASHTNGTDDIQNATAAQKGLATAAQITKLDGIEALADVTDAANVTTALNSAVLTAVTVATGDKVLIQDISDSNNLKTVTAQSIADLASGNLGFTQYEANQKSFAASGSGTTTITITYTSAFTGGGVPIVVASFYGGDTSYNEAYRWNITESTNTYFKFSMAKGDNGAWAATTSISYIAFKL